MTELWRGFANMAATAGREVVIAKGRGSTVWDDKGKAYLDSTASLWYMNVGYGRDEIADAVAAQLKELAAFHKRILESLRMAMGVFMSGDVKEARRLIAEKVELRNAELAAAERHLDRLRQGRPETLETTSPMRSVSRAASASASDGASSALSSR